jgi:glycosyltransferase involved in cell wall biosynthesis
MRIGITVDALSSPLTGIGRYTWELCKGLEGNKAIADLAYFDGLVWHKAPRRLGESSRRPRLRLLRTWQRRVSQRECRNRLVHGTNYFLPDMAETGVITVHDLSVLLYPDSHPAARVARFEKMFSNSLARASHIITDCETIRQEVLDFTGLPTERVTAVPLGVSAAFQRPVEEVYVRVLRELIGRDIEDYVLCVATFEPRKKIDAAVAAHLLMCERTGRRIPLVLVGASGWKNHALHDVMEAGQRRGSLIVLGYVADEYLPALYSGARLFVYPSIYEGFGLPPLEAMACGTPTIVSNRSCLPEVTKGAAMLTDPDDVEEFSRAIERGLYDDLWREDAVQKGRIVAKNYSWTRCIDRTLRVYAMAP